MFFSPSNSPSSTVDEKNITGGTVVDDDRKRDMVYKSAHLPKCLFGSPPSTLFFFFFVGRVNWVFKVELETTP